jgi:hypothetical protein
VYLPPSSSSLPTILEAAHATGHEGVQKTLNRVRRDFHIPHAHKMVEDFVRSCMTCQRNKSEHLQLGGLLQSLEVPSQIWADISMDFIEALPRVNGKTVVTPFPSMPTSFPLRIPTLLKLWLLPSLPILFASMACLNPLSLIKMQFSQTPSGRSSSAWPVSACV